MMRDRRTATRACAEIEAALALGLAIEDPDLQDHLRDCGRCRDEALALARLRHGLADAMEVQPPGELDRIVRQALAERPLVTGVLLRPGMATGLAVAALFALVVAVSTVLAQAGAAEMGPALGVAAVSIYLAICMAVSLPLLLLAKPRRVRQEFEVSR
jgi:hypothetical protein